MSYCITVRYNLKIKKKFCCLVISFVSNFEHVTGHKLHNLKDTSLLHSIVIAQFVCYVSRSEYNSNKA